MGFCSGQIESMNNKHANFANGERNQEMLDVHTMLKNAKLVLIIGGGSGREEYAYEIVSAFTYKNITLSHSAATLLNNMKPKAQHKVLEQLTAKM
jgi:shikimate kinase